MLTLHLLDVRPLPLMPLRVFSTEEKALEHVKNHVLTRPESFAWSLVAPTLRSVFNAEDDREVNRLARHLASGPEVAQRLYDGYADAIGQAIRDAIAHEWYWQERTPDGSVAWHGIGKSGIYAIWDQKVVRTGFIMLKRGSSSKRRSEEAPRNRGPLPRKGQSRGTPERSELVGIPEDTPMARFKLFEKCLEAVIDRYRDACLEQRRIVRVGRMDHLRSRRLEPQEWLAL